MLGLLLEANKGADERVGETLMPVLGAMETEGAILGTELGADDRLGSTDGLSVGIFDTEKEALGPELSISLGCIEGNMLGI
jgi:hypothetical protein